MSTLCPANKKTKWVSLTIGVSMMGDQQSRSVSKMTKLLRKLLCCRLVSHQGRSWCKHNLGTVIVHWWSHRVRSPSIVISNGQTLDQGLGKVPEHVLLIMWSLVMCYELALNTWWWRKGHGSRDSRSGCRGYGVEKTQVRLILVLSLHVTKASVAEKIFWTSWRRIMGNFQRTLS